MIFNQQEFDLRCEWGLQGIQQLATPSQIIVIVDVLSFSTCVEIASSKGASVFPYPWKNESALAYAQSINAELASSQRYADRPSLSPSSLRQLAVGTRLVLPSPNGATLTLQTGNIPTVAGCLRNCKAVADHVQPYQTGITIIAAGERWQDGNLRPALEDWIGAGAILSYLSGSRSPEAEAAVAVFTRFKSNLVTALSGTGSGKELISRGFAVDVELAAELDVSDSVPVLVNGAYTLFSN